MECDKSNCQEFSDAECPGTVGQCIMELASFDLVQFQKEVSAWADHNFPNNAKHIPLLGALEELGELAHAHIKLEQNIRGTPSDHTMKKKDALGDILIYLAHYCHNHQLSLGECAHIAWREVKDRDWVKFPFNGKNR